MASRLHANPHFNRTRLTSARLVARFRCQERFLALPIPCAWNGEKRVSTHNRRPANKVSFRLKYIIGSAVSPFRIAERWKEPPRYRIQKFPISRSRNGAKIGLRNRPVMHAMEREILNRPVDPLPTPSFDRRSDCPFDRLIGNDINVVG